MLGIFRGKVKFWSKMAIRAIGAKLFFHFLFRFEFKFQKKKTFFLKINYEHNVFLFFLIIQF